MDAQSWVQGLEQLAWLRLDLFVRLLLAAVLGGLVGLEREFSGKPAGFRTNLLICVGAALLTDLSISVAFMGDVSVTNADPARIAAQIVSGIGFLGAGTIIQSRGSVVGLTTAATLWVVAAIGMAVGAGQYVEAIGTTVLVIIALIALARIEKRLTPESGGRSWQLTLAPDPELPGRVRDLLSERGLRVSTVDIERHADRFTLTLRAGDSAGRKDATEIMRPLLDLPGVRRITPR